MLLRTAILPLIFFVFASFASAQNLFAWRYINEAHSRVAKKQLTDKNTQPTKSQSFKFSDQKIARSPINMSKTAIGISRALLNKPPSAPVITGPTEGDTRHGYEYNIVSTDPEGGMLQYEIDWDGSGWTVMRPFKSSISSGEILTTGHGWEYLGPKNFSVRAVDEHDVCSGWTTYTMTIYTMY